MSSDTDDEGQMTRPISVAELLARNGTIGSPPVGGRRRRRRGNSAAVTVAELTGEIPVIRDEPKAPEPVAESQPEPAAAAEPEPVAEAQPEPAAEAQPEPVAEAEAESEPAAEAESAETEVVTDEPTAEAGVREEVAFEEETAPEPESPPEAEAAAEPEPAPALEAAQVAEASPPLASDPRPHRSAGPERSHDPRPKRRPSGAEQMAFDPVDETVDIAELVGDQAAEEQQLRSYLTSSGGALFSGETVADDLARRGISSEPAPDAAPSVPGPPKRAGAPRSGGRLAAVRHALTAVLQSVLAVAFGAGMFVAFDQLWRWNTIVALVLSVLVILGLVIAVRVVRKTEDIASTLIAVAVGAMVTLGPLALLQSYS